MIKIDYLLTLFFFIISCVIGICLSLLLDIKSYLIIAFICTIIFICIELYYYSVYNSKRNNTEHINILSILKQVFMTDENISEAQKILQKYQQNQQIQQIQQDKLQYSNTPLYSIYNDNKDNNDNNDNKDNNQQNILSTPNKNITTPYTLITPDTITKNSSSSLLQIPNNTQTYTTSGIEGKSLLSLNNKQILQLDTEKKQVSIIDNKPPLDGLEPTELMNRLNYIYHATSNPSQVISYNSYKTHADKYLDEDNTKLSSDDNFLQKYTNTYHLNSNNQITSHDCLNEGSNKNSCFQSPQLFNNMLNNNMLDKGVNFKNAKLIINEDFSIPMLLDR